ncbi:MAG: DUF6702 family protein [Chloroherpetonaceae bacterium]|nr:DUF6702 family protein [Chloroherpetonaceae bacterium]
MTKNIPFNKTYFMLIFYLLLCGILFQIAKGYHLFNFKEGQHLRRTYKKQEAVYCTHNIHVSYLKIAIEGKNGMMKISFFKDDLTLALQSFSHEFSSLEPSTKLDSIFRLYLRNKLELAVSGKSVKLGIISSGEEGDMWWYQLEFNSNSEIKEFDILNSCLMELYDDQKNIIQVMHFPKEKTYSYYCIAGSNRYRVKLE